MIFENRVSCALAVAAAFAFAGCCTSDRRAAEIVSHMQTLTRVRAEPAMLSAAGRLGAELLPEFPREIYDCDMPGRPRLEPQIDCAVWAPSDTGLLTMRLAGGKTRTVVPIKVHTWYYARLARRGDQLFLLVPKLTRRQVDQRTQCECDDGNYGIAPVHPRPVFVVEGTPNSNLQEVEVPVTEDYVVFGCAGFLV